MQNTVLLPQQPRRSRGIIALSIVFVILGIAMGIGAWAAWSSDDPKADEIRHSPSSSATTSQAVTTPSQSELNPPEPADPDPGPDSSEPMVPEPMVPLPAPPDGATWLYELRTAGHQGSGLVDTANIIMDDGITDFPNSTNQWVGCAGLSYSSSFDLEGRFSTLRLALALQAHTPSGLSVQWLMTADGKTVHTGATLPGDPLTPLTIDVSGVQRLEVTAMTSSACPGAAKGYGALVQAYAQP